MLKKILLLLSLVVCSVNASEEAVERLCSDMNVPDCLLVKAVALQEGGFKNHIIMDSGSLSYGTMQIKCATARQMGFLGKCSELSEPALSIRYGIMYLHYQLQRYGYIDEAVAAYNSGTLTKCLFDIPYKCRKNEIANQAHVKKVMRYYIWLKNRSPKILDRFYAHFSRWVGLESSTIPYRKDYQTLLASVESPSP